MSLLYSESNIKSNFRRLIENLNIIFVKLKKLQLINIDIIIKERFDIIYINYSDVIEKFDDGDFTLVDYSTLKKIYTTNSAIVKDKLLYFLLFLNNRARGNIGYTSYDDMLKIVNSKTTINKYLNWLSDNMLFDYYSTNHKLDENGIPKRGNTVITKWENRELIDNIRKTDIACKNSSKDVAAMDKRFKDDMYYCKLSKVLIKYGLTNNFLLLRLWNELPFGFTWEAIFKYLNSKKNIEYFTHDTIEELTEETDSNEIFSTVNIPLVDKRKIINKVVNVAKKQEDVILSSIAELYNNILIGEAEDILIGRIHEKNRAAKCYAQIEELAVEKGKKNILSDWHNLYSDEELDDLVI